MKKTPSIPAEYGPETPGYALLNEARRRKTPAVKPTKLPKAKTGKVSPDEKPA